MKMILIIELQVITWGMTLSVRVGFLSQLGGIDHSLKIYTCFRIASLKNILYIYWHTYECPSFLKD